MIYDQTIYEIWYNDMTSPISQYLYSLNPAVLLFPVGADATCFLVHIENTFNITNGIYSHLLVRVEAVSCDNSVRLLDTYKLVGIHF